MKMRIGKLLVVMGVLLLCTMLPLSVSAQPSSELADYVDIDHLDRYLRDEFQRNSHMSHVRTEVDLLEFEIPSWLKDELLMHIRFTLPEIVVGPGHDLAVDNEHVTQLIFFPAYKLEQIRTTADMLVRGVEDNDTLTDIEKALILHDRLALWAEYDYEAAESDESTPAHTVLGTLTNRMAVCQGYALTYQYLLTRAGVSCDVHTSEIMDHAWNAVWLDGVSYMVDVTWDDRGGYSPQGYSHPVTHDYFLTSSDRYQLVDFVIAEPYGTKYDSIYWPDRAYLVGEQVYCMVNGDLCYLDGLESKEVVIPGVERIFAGEPAIEVKDKLLCSGFDWLYALDLTTGEEVDLWSAAGGIKALEYMDGRIACLVNEMWVYPFADTAYTVTFENWNGEILQTGFYEYGQLLEAPDIEPVRPGYIFTGWDKTPDVCTGDAVYTAQFTPGRADGWVQEDGKWYYFEGGLKKTGWHEGTGKWYYLNYAGVMETGLYRHVTKLDIINKKYTYYYFDSNGVMQTGWKKLDETWYYFTSSGAAATFWNEIGGRNYFFDSAGEMQTGWFYDDDKEYFLDESVGRVSGWKLLPSVWGKSWYFFDTDGDRVEGWRYIGGKWYYFDLTYGEMETGWFKENGIQYYLCDSGAMAIGWQQVNGSWYYFDSSGKMVTGWLKSGGKWYYLDDTNTAWRGQMQTNIQLNLGGKIYRFDQSGAMVTGWAKLGENWYYYDAGGARQTGWQFIGGKWYYFWTDGAMVTYFRTIDGVTYNFGSSGAMQTGWIKVPGVIYRLDGTKGDAWCYANSSGAVQFGWLKLGGNWYYFSDSSGYMYTGSRNIDGKWYTFAESGICQNP